MSSLLLLANQLKEVAVGYTVGLVTLIIIGVSLLNILYRILKWIIRVDMKMSALGEFVQSYKQLQEEKEIKNNKANSIASNVEKSSTESNNA
jgi:hypothetical protein